MRGLPGRTIAFFCFAGCLVVLASSVRLQGSALAAPGLGKVADKNAAPSGTAELEDGNHALGKPFVEENLAVFPIYAAKQEPGEFVALQVALKERSAVVRELGRTGWDGQAGAQVNTLEIDNLGKLPIFALAGTVLKGGNQDRQIGQDIVVPAHASVAVKAFCVEHGRWSGSRDGQVTQGIFEALPVLAQSKVRSAGQYEGSQVKVWAQVQTTNALTGKQSASGTLISSIGDSDLWSRTEALAARASRFLRSHDAGNDMVGVAYAVNGKLVASRYFANHDLFAQNETLLLNTAAMEALTAKVAAIASGTPVPDGKLAPTAAKDVLDKVHKGNETRSERTEGGNTNTYLHSDLGYGSQVMMNGSYVGGCDDVY